MRVRSSLSSGLSSGLLLGLLLLGPLSLPGCARSKPEPVDVAPPGRYGDGAAGLDAFFRDVLVAAQKDDRQRVHDLFASLMMSKAELARLFGAERAAALWARYEAVLGTMANIGAVELVASVYEKKLDDVSVVRVDQLPEAEQLPVDRAVLAAMTQRVPLYTARVKKKAETRGLRYDFFVYLDGRWRTGNLLGKHLAPEVPATMPGAAPPPAGKAGGAAPATAPTPPAAPAAVKKKG